MSEMHNYDNNSLPTLCVNTLVLISPVISTIIWQINVGLLVLLSGNTLQSGMLLAYHRNVG